MKKTLNAIIWVLLTMTKFVVKVMPKMPQKYSAQSAKTFGICWKKSPYWASVVRDQGHEENIKCNNLGFVDNDKYLQEKRRLHSCMVICQSYKLACQLFIFFAPNLTW